MKDVDESRAEILRLRARIVALEKMAMAAMELVLRIRPEELDHTLELARSRLSVDYGDKDFASEISDPEERAFLSKEVERLMRGIQADLGFKGGVRTFEDG